MKLALSALLVVSSLLTPQAHAAGEGLTLDLPYIVRNGEALIGVATAPGRLRFYNQGPSAARLRWFDPKGGETEQRILGPGQVLLSYGSLGVPVSPGTIVLLEQLGPGPFSIGFASLPTSASVFGYHPSHTPDNLFGDNSPKGSPSGCPASIWTAGATTGIWTDGTINNIWDTHAETMSIWTDGTMTSIAPDGYVYLLLAGNHQNSPSVAIPPIGTYLAPNASPFLDGHVEKLP